MIKISDEDFRKKVEEMVTKYCITDCIYKSCIDEFHRLKLIELKEIDRIRIITPFLLTWGQMQRWLGYVGVERVFQKLKEPSLSVRIEPLRQKDLRKVELERLKNSIIELFNELSKTSFQSKSGKKKVKNINSTATSKILHLCCPDLFVMWDRNIRSGYRKYNGGGEDYFQFLKDMKEILNALQDTVEELQKKYHLRPTRIIDMYNWAKYIGEL